MHPSADPIRTEETLTLRLSGSWQFGQNLPSTSKVCDQFLSESGIRKVIVDGAGLEEWNDALLSFLLHISQAARAGAIPCEFTHLPTAAHRLLQLALAVPENPATRRTEPRRAFLARVGEAAMAARKDLVAILTFLGEVTRGSGRFLAGRARYRRADFWVTVQACGPRALGIVSTISFLVGLILSFVGSMQMRRFGADILVADVVGVGTVMEMGALMTGVILAGRTGAAFAAQLGTMEVNEEIDALRTLGLRPIDYLVIPRMLALALMTPLLVLYADLMGILGGALVGTLFLKIPAVLYFNQTINAISPWFFAQGLIKGTAFGVLVALAGCMRGMQCGRSASAVGDAATSAVVTSIVFIVLADAALTCVFMAF